MESATGHAGARIARPTGADQSVGASRWCVRRSHPAGRLRPPRRGEGGAECWGRL